MSDSNIVSIRKKVSEINELEKAIVDGVYNGEFSIMDIPENVLTTKIVIALLVTDAYNYKSLPFNFRSKEFALLSTQLNRKVYEELSEHKVLPIEIHSWVAANTNQPILSYFPQHLMDIRFCTEVIKVNAANIEYLPKQLFEDKEYLTSLVSVTAKSVKFIPIEHVTKELCDIAFEQANFDLDFIPLEFRTQEFCEKAFRRNYKSIFAIPVDFFTSDMLNRALGEAVDGEVNNIIERTPKELQTEKFWKKVIQKDSKLLRLVPENIITEHFVYDIAPYIKKAAHLKNVKQGVLENTNVKYRLIECNPLLLEALPNTAKDEMLCYQAVSANGMALEFTPSIYHGARMYDAALANNGLSIKHIPTPYRDENIPMQAVMQNGEAIEYVNPSYVNLDLCRIAIKNNARAIYFLPPQYKAEYSLYLLAIQHNPQNLSIIDERFRSAEICRIAFRANAKNWEHIPVNLRTDNEIISLYKTYKKEGFFNDELQSNGS